MDRADEHRVQFVQESLSEARRIGHSFLYPGLQGKGCRVGERERNNALGRDAFSKEGGDTTRHSSRLSRAGARKDLQIGPAVPDNLLLFHRILEFGGHRSVHSNRGGRTTRYSPWY